MLGTPRLAAVPLAPFALGHYLALSPADRLAPVRES